METYEIESNLVIDTETGEILGEAVNNAGAIASQEVLEAVLYRIADVESQLVALRAKHDSIIENCRKLEGRKASYLAYLKGVYSNPIEEYAKARLEGGKSKTLTTPYGQVSFRTVKGGLRVANNDLAASYAIGTGLSHAVKLTYNFQISKLTDEQRHSIATSAILPEGFEVVPDKETMSIKVVN
jgi:hypothetical protein